MKIFSSLARSITRLRTVWVAALVLLFVLVRWAAFTRARSSLVGSLPHSLTPLRDTCSIVDGSRSDTGRVRAYGVVMSRDVSDLNSE